MASEEQKMDELANRVETSVHLQELPDLPQEIIPDILLRLPQVKSLLRFRTTQTAGHITEREAGDAIFKHFFQGKLTFLHLNKGEEMAPTVGGAQGGTLLVRKIPVPSPMQR